MCVPEPGIFIKLMLPQNNRPFIIIVFHCNTNPPTRGYQAGFTPAFTAVCMRRTMEESHAEDWWQSHSLESQDSHKTWTSSCFSETVTSWWPLKKFHVHKIFTDLTLLIRKHLNTYKRTTYWHLFDLQGPHKEINTSIPFSIQILIKLRKERIL